MKPKLSAPIVLVLSLLSGLFFPVSALAAGDYPTCAPNTLCTVGEFLYDDEYAPIATADCRLTAREPDGDLFINSAAMSASADGWYSINVATASAVGVYRSQVCCTSGADYLCLDKTFEVVASVSAITASDVWSFSGRSLDDYGTLVADIWANSTRTLSSYTGVASDVWAYSSRSLSSFGTLIADVWNYGTRTITGGGDTVSNTYNTTNNNTGSVSQTNTGAVTNNYTTNTTSNVTNVQLENLASGMAQNRQLLEEIVNKPVVKTFIDESVEGPNLESKIDRTKNAATRLYAGATNIKSHVQLLSLQWPILSTLDIQNELNILAQTISEDNDKKDSSVLSLSHWLKDAWGNSLTLEISDQVETINSKIDSLKRNLEVSGKAGINTYPSPLDSILIHVDRLTTVIGNISHSGREQSLYGFIKYTSELSDSYNKETEAIGQVLAKWDTTSESERTQTVDKLVSEVMASNQISSGERFLENKLKNAKNILKNKLFSLLALIETNKIYLTNNVGQSIQNVWLEEGSIVFRAVVTNPSKTISQKVPLKYFLPPEVKKEQIISADSELTIDYDTNEGALFASAEIVLAPEETRTFTVEVEDIWTYTQEELDAYKKQVQILIVPLANTAYFAQGASLQSDINVTLEKVMVRQKQAITPESRIRSHRESALEMVGVDEKINALKQLVSQASSTGSIFGFVGGVQSIGIWGLIIILVAGFVFLSLYMRAMYQEQHRFASSTILPSAHKHLLPPPAEAVKQVIRKTTLSRARRLTKMSMIILLTGSFALFGASIILSTARKNNITTMISPLVTENGLVLGASAPTKTEGRQPGN